MNSTGVTVVGLVLVLLLFIGSIVRDALNGDTEANLYEAAKKEGQWAYTDGAPIWANPYPMAGQGKLNHAWRWGYNERRQESGEVKE
jgi:hypothetical protein